VLVTDDGKLVLAGAPNAGQVQQWSCSERPTLSDTSLPPSAAVCTSLPSLSAVGAPPFFGASMSKVNVSVPSATTVVVIGAPGDSTTKGVAYLYWSCSSVTGCDSVSRTTLVPLDRDRVEGDQFGAAVWVSANADGSLVVSVNSQK
jgi:hypothetical protein